MPAESSLFGRFFSLCKLVLCYGGNRSRVVFVAGSGSAILGAIIEILSVQFSTQGHKVGFIGIPEGRGGLPAMTRASHETLC